MFTGGNKSVSAVRVFLDFSPNAHSKWFHFKFRSSLGTLQQEHHIKCAGFMRVAGVGGPFRRGRWWCLKLGEVRCSKVRFKRGMAWRKPFWKISGHTDIPTADGWEVGVEGISPAAEPLYLRLNLDFSNKKYLNTEKSFRMKNAHFGSSANFFA